ncbi:hypothetical protein TcCL_ESM05545 [Trypanosoma cruzi]|nr:hypothetical protein TcCL_ESM05545 [Trypanosoma cruzi]
MSGWFRGNIAKTESSNVSAPPPRRLVSANPGAAAQSPAQCLFHPGFPPLRVGRPVATAIPTGRTHTKKPAEPLLPAGCRHPYIGFPARFRRPLPAAVRRGMALRERASHSPLFPKGGKYTHVFFLQNLCATPAGFSGWGRRR